VGGGNRAPEEIIIREEPLLESRFTVVLYSSVRTFVGTEESIMGAQ